MKLEVQLRGLDGVLETLKRLPPEVVSKKGGPVLASLRKGARVLVKQSRDNFRAAVAMPGKTGITDTTGFTEKQIVSKRRRMPSGQKGERIVVTVNPKPHPTSKGKYRGRTIRANDIAFIMEAGNSKQPATPWLRPAFAAKSQEALRTVERDLVVRVDRIVKKLAAQNEGK